jgi:dolichol-phosphate hexosyltransferase
MIQNKTISLVIPCYNEEEGIAHVLKSLPRDVIDEVLVVDNNSTDRTAEVATSSGARVVSEKIQGYGAAYQRGFREATKDIIVTMDGDGTYPVEEITFLVKHLIDQNLDFISGTRFPLKNKKSMFGVNKLGNTILTWIFNLVTFKRIKDCESGMWVFKRQVVEQMKLKNNGIPLSVEIKMEAVLNKNIKFAEVPITYKSRLGMVKLCKWKDGWGSLKLIFQKRLEIFLRKIK